jgi:hypothetical protein
MKRPRPLPAGPVKELRRRTQRTRSSTAQPNRVMVELRTMHTELFMRTAVSWRLCAIKSKFGASLGRGTAKTKRRVNDGFGPVAEAGAFSSGSYAAPTRSFALWRCDLKFPHALFHVAN